MSSIFAADFFKSNRARLREQVTDDALIVVTANGLLQRNSDTTLPFRQDSSFWYLTGINEPDVVLVMDNSKEYLIVPTRGAARVAFDGDYNRNALAKRSGVTKILGDREGWRQLAKSLRQSDRVATPAKIPAYVTQHGFYTNPARARLIRRLKASNDRLELNDIRSNLASLRSIKQPQELKAIQKAIDMTIKSIARIYHERNSFKNECEIEAVLSAEFISGGARHAYQPIIASGKNACLLHYIDNNSKINNQELLLVDAGAEVENYAADITRTFPISRLSKRQKEVLAVVLEVQEFAKNYLKPGVMIKDYEQAVEQYMGQKLKQLKVIKTISHRQIRKYYPHATSHFLGLDVHDVGDYKQPLEPGMVLTVEPGIYIPEEHIGVRIEDDILITDTGHENLSKRLPASLG